MKKLWYFAYIPAILWMLVIGGFSGSDSEHSSSLSLKVTQKIVEIIDVVKDMSDDECRDMVEKLHYPVRKLAHMTEYAILYILMAIPSIMLFGGSGRFKWMVYAVLVFCAIYAAADEYHQSFVPGRDGNIKDVLIDSVGASIGMLLTFGVNKLANCKIKRKCEQ